MRHRLLPLARPKRPARPARLRPQRPAAAGGLVIALAALTATAWLQPGGRTAVARADDTTVSVTSLRTGWDSNEAPITPAAVKTFTQKFKVPVTGQVYAQPLVIGGLHTVIVATEDDQIYGLNSATGAQLWSTPLGTPFPISTAVKPPCVDLSPNIGVTSTPVYDPAAGPNGTVYMMAQTGGTTPNWALWGVDPVTGIATKIQTISGHPANNSGITFDPIKEFARPGLLLMNGWVYAAFGSHCDRKPYAGYVAGVNPTSKAVTLWTDETGVVKTQAGIWQGGSGVMSDGPGRIFVTSGNGVSPVNGPGSNPPGTLAESVIRLAVNPSTGALSASSFFSPNNASALDAADRDFGSGGPVGLPFGTQGTTAYPHLLVQVGKDGRIFILNRDNLGGRTTNNSGALYVAKAIGGEWGHPAAFGDTNPLTPANAAKAHDYLLYVGRNEPLRVFKFGVAANGKPTLTDIANGSLNFRQGSGSLIVTSNGSNANSAVLWEVFAATSIGVGAILESYDVSSTALAACTGKKPCTLAPIFSAPIGTSAKFCVVAATGGWVYVGTRDGHVYAFGPKTSVTPLIATSTTLAATQVGTPTTKIVTLTAQKPTTVTAVSAATGASNAPTPGTQFLVTGVTVTKKGTTTPVPATLPVKLFKGDELNATVTFTPTAPGGTDGTLQVTGQGLTQPAANVPLVGSGTQAALFAQPSSLDFPLAPDHGEIAVPVGLSVPGTVVISNFGTSNYTITSVNQPKGAFSFSPAGSVPTKGQILTPGQSISVAVLFSPLTAGPATGSFTITGTSAGAATSTTVSLNGLGVAAVSQLTAPTVDFGTIAVGKAATLYVHVANAGNTAATVVGTSSLPTPFKAVLTPQPGMPFNSDYDMYVPVKFTPKKAGSFTAHYVLTWTDFLGKHTLTVLLTGTAK